MHLGHPWVALQQIRQLIQGRTFVVDHQHPQTGHADTPGANFGTRTTTLVPAPGAVSTTRPYSSPNVLRSRSSTLARPTESPATPERISRIRSGSSPAPLSSIEMTHSWSTSRASIDDPPLRGDRLEPVLHGVLHQGLQAQERDAHPEHLGRHLQGDVQPVTEAGLLQEQVALHRAQLLGQGGELAVLAEGVAGEVGELQQQVAGPVGIGAHEGGDGAERVVDEVRADLRAQGADLGAHEPVPGLVELGQLELAGRPAGHLLGRAQQARRGLVGERDQGAGDPVVDDQRAGDRVPHQASRGRARQLCSTGHDRAGRGDRPERERERLVAVVGGEPVVPEQLAGVGDRDRRGAQQVAQVSQAALHRLRVQSLAQRRGGEGSRVQRAERGLVCVAAELAGIPAAAQPLERHRLT